MRIRRPGRGDPYPGHDTRYPINYADSGEPPLWIRSISTAQTEIGPVDIIDCDEFGARQPGVIDDDQRMDRAIDQVRQRLTQAADVQPATDDCMCPGWSQLAEIAAAEVVRAAEAAAEERRINAAQRRRDLILRESSFPNTDDSGYRW